jgi:hypothetical protein
MNYRIFDDMVSTETDSGGSGGPFHTFVGNWNVPGDSDASVTSSGADVNPTHRCMGVAVMSTGAVAQTDEWISLWQSDNAFLFGYAAVQAEFRVRMNIVPGTNFNARLGYQDTLTSAPTDGTLPVDGVYFKIDGDVNANWLFQTASASTRTQVDTGVAVATAAYQKLTISVNAAGTSAQGFINGVLVATIATNIPTIAGQETGFGATILRETTAATNYQLSIDYISQSYQYSVAR